MLRGNHETTEVNQYYGFLLELEKRFKNADGVLLWKEFNNLFACLPLAALISNRILCMHGGICPELKSLDDIRRVCFQ